MKMKKYVNVYPFQAIEKLKEGKEVFCIDRGIHEVHIVKTLPVQTLVSILKESDKEENYERYEFYYIENVNESVKNDEIS
jgi:hypothetical protein